MAADDSGWAMLQLFHSEKLVGCSAKSAARSCSHMTVTLSWQADAHDGGLVSLQGHGPDGVLQWRSREKNGGTRINRGYRAGGYTRR